MSTNKKFYIGEINKAKYEEFKASNLCIAMVKEIMGFTNLERNTTEEMARVQFCIPAENVAERIAFTIVTANKTMPLETIVGMVGSSITKKKQRRKVRCFFFTCCIRVCIICVKFNVINTK